MLTHPKNFLPLLATVLVASLVACTPDEDSDVPELPDDSDTVIPEDTGPFEIPDDTDDVGPADLEPLNYLYLYQEGSVTLTPGGGPYTALTGSLEVLELVDFQLPEPDTDNPDTDTDLPWADLEDSPVACQATYTLIGSPPPPEAGAVLCDGCAWMMDVEFAVASGNPGPCYDPDLPDNEETLRFAWHPGQGQLLYDYQGTGVWYPWFPGSSGGDSVDFNWNARLGVSIEEEDDG